MSALQGDRTRGRKRRKMKEEEENGEVKKAGGSDGREDETDRVRTMERRDGGEKGRGGKRK